MCVAIFLVEGLRILAIVVQVVFQSLPFVLGVTDGNLVDIVVLMGVEEVGSSTTACFCIGFCRKERRGGVSGSGAGASCLLGFFDAVFGA